MNPWCVKVEWCERFILAAFGKHHAFAGRPDAGIEVGLFWQMAERAGLWKPGVFGGPMSQALEKLTRVQSVRDMDGHVSYNVFRLREEAELHG